MSVNTSFDDDFILASVPARTAKNMLEARKV